jgi:hypothetical protein
MRSVFIGDSLELKFAPKLDCSLTVQVLRVAGWGDNTSGLAEAVRLAKNSPGTGKSGTF